MIKLTLHSPRKPLDNESVGLLPSQSLLLLTYAEKGKDEWKQWYSQTIVDLENDPPELLIARIQEAMATLEDTVNAAAY